MKRHLGKARYPAILIVAIAVVAIFVRIQLFERSSALATISNLIPTPGELATALIRVGLDAGALTAAGASSSNIDLVIGNGLDHLMTESALLTQVDTEFAQSRRQCAQLKRIIQSGGATLDQISACSAAQAQLALARGARQELLDSLFDDATVGLNENQRNTLATIRSNRHWDLPLEFLVVDRAESEWVALRDCLANERISAEFDDEDPDPVAQAVLGQLRSHPAVVAANGNLDANLAVLTVVWQGAVDG